MLKLIVQERHHPVVLLGSALLLAGLALCSGAQAHEPEEKRPSILLIVADDLGYSDLGAYGGEIRTPNIDALAENGLRFTQFYNSSRCCPSRASLLTGVYPHQAGIGWFVSDHGQAGYAGRLNRETVTLAEVLKGAGYDTYISGKWHVNTPGPTRRGFDAFYGFVHGYAVDSWNERMMIRLPEGKPAPDDDDGDFYATDAITDHALEFMQRSAETGRPFFLYVAYQAPHFPLQAPPEMAAQYTDVYRQGWDRIREDRMERMQALGLVDEEVPLSPRGPIDLARVARRLGSMTPDGHNPPWEALEPDRQADLAQRMAVYAAMVERMDQNVGRLVESLRDSGELENTLIVFVSDNGACAEWEPWGFDLRAADFVDNPPGHGIDGGTPGKPNVLHTGDDLARMGGPESTLFSYGSGWANASNTPLRLYKHYAHEGGIRTPFIAHWPAKINDPGALRRQVGHLIDLMPTFVEVAGAEYPATFDGRRILPMEGMSLVDTLAGGELRQRTLLFEHEKNAAFRRGDWKIVASDIIQGDGLREGAAWELYNLANDPTEQVNLAAQHPDLVEEMARLFLHEARRTRVLPAP